jgi:hypothetical protein
LAEWDFIVQTLTFTTEADTALEIKRVVVMKRFLLFLGSFGLGLATLVLAFGLVAASEASGGEAANIVFGAILFFIVALIFGIALSAPYALSPPEDGRSWWISLPIVLALALLLVRAIAFVGYVVLLGFWKLVFLFWRREDRRQADHQLGQPAPYAQAYVSGGPVPPSWQRDPTGRFMQRYWDGRAWTSHVANGGNVGVDPI